MAKKKSTKKKLTEKLSQNSTAAKKTKVAKAAARFPGLAAMRAAGAKIIEAHFQGFGDDGCFEYRVIGDNKKLGVSAAAGDEMEAFLQEHFDPYGEGMGSVLLAQFDLVKCVCRGFDGDGDPPTRLAELLCVLQAHGVKKVVGELQAGRFSKCKVDPAAAMPRKLANEHVSSLVDRVNEYSIECGEYDEEIGYEGKEYALLDTAKSTVHIDVPKRRVTLKRLSPPRLLAIAPGKLKARSFPLHLS